MTITRSMKVSQLVFRHESYIALLLEMSEYFKSHPNRAIYIEDTVIVWDGESQGFLATVYINDVMED